MEYNTMHGSLISTFYESKGVQWRNVFPIESRVERKISSSSSSSSALSSGVRLRVVVGKVEKKVVRIWPLTSCSVAATNTMAGTPAIASQLQNHPVLEALPSSPFPSETARDDPHLRDGLSFFQFMAAGSIAGMVEHMAMFPVDTLKTRMQMVSASSASSSPSAPVSRFLLSIMRSEGPLGLYRGIGAMGLGAGPAHAVYFSVYETCKEKLGGNRPGHHPLVHAASGVIATTASDAVLTPMDVVKQRLQLRQSPYGGVRDCIMRMLREEGLSAFYASYRTTVVMNAPFTAVHFSTYEAAKKVLGGISPDNANEEQLLVHITAGGVAGTLASAVTTPLDVVKTRLQCQGVCGADTFSSSSIRMAIKKIVAKEGPQALLQGLKPRVLFHAPAAAICWSTYEAMKGFLQQCTENSSLPQP